MARDRILLGVTGGIASYKAIWLARQLTEQGAEVDVVMTSGAQQFVAPITFEAVTGRKVHTEIFGSGNALDHIRLARQSDIIVVAPATADFIARAATGQANDLLTASLLAADCPIVISPAMNDRMWAHPQTQLNVEHLGKIGYHIIPPDTGPLAVGEGSGPGRLPEPTTIALHIRRVLKGQTQLTGLKVVVTAGATREPLDPVRFISNFSTGKMGVAVAVEAWKRGADVTLITGHIDVEVPSVINRMKVVTTDDMLGAVMKTAPVTDCLVMAAAPADFKAAQVAGSKMKKTLQTDGEQSVLLHTNPDILASSIKVRKADSITVGFALETDNLLENATSKLQRKGLDLIVLNEAGTGDSGFGTDTNRVTLIESASRIDELPLLSKDLVAGSILDRVEHLLHIKRTIQ